MDSVLARQGAVTACWIRDSGAMRRTGVSGLGAGGVASLSLPVARCCRPEVRIGGVGTNDGRSSDGLHHTAAHTSQRRTDWAHMHVHMWHMGPLANGQVTARAEAAWGDACASMRNKQREPLCTHGCAE